VVYTEWIFFALMAFGLMRLRARADYKPAYRVWGYPAVPIVFALSSLYVVASQVVASPVESVTGLMFVAAGWPVFALTARRTSEEPSQKTPS
jgi:APA family basic amino acid/polyamine antiporter